MSSIVVGTYQPGTFLMKLFLNNYSYDTALFEPAFVGDEECYDVFGKTYGRELATERILTFMHECNHYIHDLSLSACIAQDYFQDEISFFVKYLSENCSQITYPIFGQETEENNRKYIPIKLFRLITDKLSMQTFLFDSSHTSSKSPKYSFLFDEAYLQYTDGKGLSYNELLEGYVHYKSASDLMWRAMITGKYDYIRQFKDKYNIYPYSYNDACSSIDISRIYGKSYYIYHIARVIYMSFLSSFDWKNAFSYLETEWPKGYESKNNAWSILDSGFFFLLDIALTIPPIAYIPTLMEEGGYCIEDFSPVHRFLMALHIVRENQKFPDAKHGESYYKTLFNFIAEHPSANWPNLGTTLSTWEIFFDKIKKKSHDTSAGYRHRMFKYKFTKYHTFFLNIPSVILNQTSTPLFCLARGGELKIFRRIGSYNVPYEGLFEAYDLYTMPFVEWKEYPDISDFNEFIKQEIEHCSSFMREIVYRLISHNISESLMFRKEFTCCFYNDEYFAAIQSGMTLNSKLPPHLFCRSMDKCKCCKITDLQQLPLERCAVRDYLINYNYKIIQMKWQK